MSGARDYPSRTVVRVDRSPMNRKVRVVQLDCGHDAYVSPGLRVPKVGKAYGCEKCAQGRGDA